MKGEGRVAGTVAREASGGKSGGKVADEVANEVGAVRGSGKSFEENVAGCVGQNSFSPETLVATNTGEKPIGEVKVGDQVLAYDEASGTNGNYPVQAVLINDDPAEVFLSINGETVETTPEHPWYTEDRAWVNAGELRLGEHIHKADGSYGSVQSIKIVYKPKIMYNLTVEKAHTFFVGQQQWLVHNSCIPPTKINAAVLEGAGWNKLEGRANDIGAHIGVASDGGPLISWNEDGNLYQIRYHAKANGFAPADSPGGSGPTIKLGQVLIGNGTRLPESDIPLLLKMDKSLVDQYGLARDARGLLVPNEPLDLNKFLGNGFHLTTYIDDWGVVYFNSSGRLGGRFTNDTHIIGEGNTYKPPWQR